MKAYICRMKLRALGNEDLAVSYVIEKILDRFLALRDYRSREDLGIGHLKNTTCEVIDRRLIDELLREYGLSFYAQESAPFPRILCMKQIYVACMCHGEYTIKTLGMGCIWPLL